MRKNKNILLMVISVFLLCGCAFDSERGIKPDDDISACVCDSIGDSFRYLGKKQKPNNVIDYMYYAPYESITAENISLFMNTVATISVDDSECIEFNICPLISGRYGGTCSLQNYVELTDDDKETYIGYSEICVYTIGYQELSDPILMDPSTFIGVVGVKYLRVSKDMQEKADEAGIDWYEIWPDLEGIEVF